MYRKTCTANHQKAISRISLVFSTLDLSGQPDMYTPQSFKSDSSIEECLFDQIAAGIFQFFTSGIVKEFYETEEPVAPFSLSHSNGTLAGLLTILFFSEAGRVVQRIGTSKSPTQEFHQNV